MVKTVDRIMSFLTGALVIGFIYFLIQAGNLAGKDVMAEITRLFYIVKNFLFMKIGG